MKYYVNGYKNSMVLVQDSLQNELERINFPLCDKDGMFEYIIHVKDFDRKLLNGNNDRNTKGFHLQFVLSFKSKMIVTDLKNVEKIINYSIDKNTTGNRIILIPRIDSEWRRFEVDLINDKIALGILKHGDNSAGNKGIELIFETVKMLHRSELNWIDPNAVVFYGYEPDQASGVLQTS